jgi:tetratricopeptide (TPR) repeat protein
MILHFRAPALWCIFLLTLLPVPAQTQTHSTIPDPNNPAAISESEKQLEGLIHQKRWAEAAELVGELIQKDPTNPRLHFWQGMVRFEGNDPISAIAAFRSAERLGLDTEGLHKALGLTYYVIHQYILFEQQMDKAIKMDPKDYEPVYYLGRYYETTRNNFSRARDFFDRAVGLKPNDTKSIFNRGYCLEMMGRLDEARTNYEQAIRLVEEIQERYSWPYQGMARLLLTSDPEQALHFAERAVKLEPDLDSNHLVLAKVEERMQNTRGAIAELQIASRLNPTSAPPHYALARLYKRIGNPEAARAQIEEFNKLNSIYEPR